MPRQLKYKYLTQQTQLWLTIQFTQQTLFFWKFQNLSLLQLISKLHSLSLLTLPLPLPPWPLVPSHRYCMGSLTLVQHRQCRNCLVSFPSLWFFLLKSFIWLLEKRWEKYIYIYIYIYINGAAFGFFFVWFY